MPAGAALVRYAGKRGIVWRIKYLDADGRQVMETLGPEREGWTAKKAEAELRERLVRVEKRGWRRPAPLTFAEYAETWFAEGAARRRWKPSTVAQYRSVRERLVGHFGPMPLAAIRPGTSLHTSPRPPVTSERPPSPATCRSCTRST